MGKLQNLIFWANRLKVLGVAVFFSVTQLGCDFPLVKGHYEGNLTQLIDGKDVTQPVSLEIAKQKNSQNVEVKDENLKPLLTFEITVPEKHLFMKSKTFDLTIPSLSPKPFSLKKSKNCFVSQTDSSQSFRVKFCFESQSFYISATDTSQVVHFTLTADLFAKEEEVFLEPAVNIALPDAITRALQKNFQARIEFEKAFQASKGAEEQYLSLLPHFNISTITNNLSTTLVTLPSALLASIGDLAPFLLPNRWLQAKEAGDVGKAASVAQILMQINLATEVEGIAYVFERDRKILFMLGQIIDWMTGLGKKIKDLETNSSLPAGSSSSFQILLAKVQQEGAKAESVLQTDRFLFSQTLGYINPEAIGMIDLGDEALPIDKATDLDPTALWKIAENRSFELKQLDFLIEAARNTKKQIFFSWLDPQADSHSNVGAAMMPRIEISNSQIRELQVAREQLQATIVRQAYDAINSYNSAIHDYQYSKQILPDLEQKLFDKLQAVLSDKKLDCDALQNEIETFLNKKISEENTLATFRVARAKIDRLLLQGFYSTSYQQFMKKIYNAESVDNSSGKGAS